jgi:hypothetical protein
VYWQYKVTFEIFCEQNIFLSFSELAPVHMFISGAATTVGTTRGTDRQQDVRYWTTAIPRYNSCPHNKPHTPSYCGHQCWRTARTQAWFYQHYQLMKMFTMSSSIPEFHQHIWWLTEDFFCISAQTSATAWLEFLEIIQTYKWTHRDLLTPRSLSVIKWIHRDMHNSKITISDQVNSQRYT